MRTAHIALLLAFAISLQAERTSHARELVSFEPSVFQSKKKIASAWNAIAEDRRDTIQAYLFSLGLSSTGVIQLIGVYHDNASGALFHFQQLDLHGTRLFWSVLVDPTEMSARVIYHPQSERISEGFAAIPAAP